MKLNNKNLEIENEKFKVVQFDEERYEKSNRTHLYYIVECKKCGCQFSRKKEAIVNRFDKLICPDCRHNRNGKPLNTLLYNVYIHYKNNAKARNIEWELNEEDFKQLVTQNCYYCGDEPKQTSTSTYKDNFEAINGIDRIDSNKSYNVENCVSCCATCNIMKGTLSKYSFLSQIHKIYNKCIKSSETIENTLENNESKQSTPQANGGGNGN